MAYTGTPVVHHKRLFLEAASKPIQLGTKAWFAWLQTATSFSYRTGPPLAAFTLRKEKRRHGWYWYAYVKIDAKLHNAYVGRSERLTATHLDLVAQRLLTKFRNARLAAQAQGGD